MRKQERPLRVFSRGPVCLADCRECSRECNRERGAVLDFLRERRVVLVRDLARGKVPAQAERAARVTEGPLMAAPLTAEGQGDQGWAACPAREEWAARRAAFGARVCRAGLVLADRASRGTAEPSTTGSSPSKKRMNPIQLPSSSVP